MTVDILAFGAHPDDIELSCGATLAKSIKEGKSVALIDLTQGELGTRGTAETRKHEAAQAAQILGIQQRENLKMPDGFFENSLENKMQIIQCIRRYQPTLVLCNALSDRHPDHGRAAQLVSEACFLSGLLKIETQDEKGQIQKEWRPKQVWHYIQWDEIIPEFVIDVSGFEEIKMDAVMAYQTQFYDPNSQEKETPISSQNFLNSIQYRMQNFGRLAGVEFAEGFISEKLLCIKNIDALM